MVTTGLTELILSLRCTISTGDLRPADDHTVLFVTNTLGYGGSRNISSIVVRLGGDGVRSRYPVCQEGSVEEKHRPLLANV